MQVWSILDLHYLNICSSIYWHLCDICSTQAEEQGMGLWHKSGDLVCWFVLWLRYNSSSLPVCNPQILLCTCWPCATILSIWVFPVCLYSGTGKFFLFLPLRKHEIRHWFVLSYQQSNPCFMQCMSIVPLDIFRWVVAGVAGFMSATFVALNLRAHIKSAGERWFLIVAGIFLLQLALAVVLKVYLFTVSV